ncbi:MAG TPA: DUF2807 domain-containing protein [Sphingomicrobium sp.]|nr:DUF2807 domain-containing protein [Sphingomicrobium sp.]
MNRILPLFASALAASAPALATETVAVTAFQSIELHGGGDILLKRAPVQHVTITEGSSRFTNVQVLSRGRLRIDACNAQCPRNYRLNILVESPTVPILAIDGGGKITAAEGFAGQRQLVVAVNGAGIVDATKVQVDTATAAVSGGGEIKLRALRALTAAVNGGGLVRYWGNPRLTTAIRGGGAVRASQ